MDLQKEREIFVEFLRRRGLRRTPERLALFEEIFRQHGHVDAEDVLAALGRRGVKISRATVYRGLDLLAECDLVRRHHLGRRRLLYEHIHPGQQHDHLVCSACGRVAEFVSGAIRALQREICKAHRFDPSEVSLEISALCRECAERRERRAEAPRPAAHAGGFA